MTQGSDEREPGMTKANGNQSRGNMHAAQERRTAEQWRKAGNETAAKACEDRASRMEARAAEKNTGK